MNPEKPEYTGGQELTTDPKTGEVISKEEHQARREQERDEQD